MQICNMYNQNRQGGNIIKYLFFIYAVIDTSLFIYIRRGLIAPHTNVYLYQLD